MKSNEDEDYLELKINTAQLVAALNIEHNQDVAEISPIETQIASRIPFCAVLNIRGTDILNMTVNT